MVMCMQLLHVLNVYSLAHSPHNVMHSSSTIDLKRIFIDLVVPLICMAAVVQAMLFISHMYKLTLEQWLTCRSSPLTLTQDGMQYLAILKGRSSAHTVPLTSVKLYEGSGDQTIEWGRYDIANWQD